LTGITFSNGTANVSWYGTDKGSSTPWSMFVSTNLTAGWMLVASNSIARDPQGTGTNTWADAATGGALVRFYRPAVLVP